MGKEDDSLNTSLAHIVLCCVAGQGISTMQGKSWTHPGMHANFLLHGVLGFVHYQSGILDNDFKTAYVLSLNATRYLALPCLMADLYRSDNTMATLHLASGALPFVLALSGQDNLHLGNVMIACNIASLCYYSSQHNREWGWYTAASAVLAYFIVPPTGQKMLYPLSLALMEYCAYKIFTVHFTSLGGPGGSGAPAPPRR